MCSAGSAWTLLQAGYPIRRSPDHRLLPASRCLSQVAASFFGSWCLGIHLGPLVACLAHTHPSTAQASRLNEPLATGEGGHLRSSWPPAATPAGLGSVDRGSRFSTALRHLILNLFHRLFGCQCAGGDERTRTADPLLAKQVLSQLSYIPAWPQPRKFVMTAAGAEAGPPPSACGRPAGGRAPAGGSLQTLERPEEWERPDRRDRDPGSNFKHSSKRTTSDSHRALGSLPALACRSNHFRDRTLRAPCGAYSSGPSRGRFCMP